MTVLLLGKADGYIQFISVLVVFVLVLGLTALTTRWIARYQKQQNVNGNIEVLETTQMAGGKYIQIVRIGQHYIAVAVCKDTVTMLCEVSQEELQAREAAQMPDFHELLKKAIRKAPEKSGDKPSEETQDKLPENGG